MHAALVGTHAWSHYLALIEATGLSVNMSGSVQLKPAA